jgi:DUF971 family protein
MDPKPSSITADRQTRQVTILWDDDHTSIYPFELLRLGCPCVQCRGGHSQMSSEPNPSIFGKHMEDGPAIHLINIVSIGSYAITPVWEDNHDYGIYKWDYLRKLCPCHACHPESKIM